MGRTRSIRPGFFTNDLLGGLRPVVRLLFAGLWTVADREGRLRDRPRKLKAELLAYDRLDVDEALEELTNAGFIIRYETNGDQYIQITKWYIHQRPHPREEASQIPPIPEFARPDLGAPQGTPQPDLGVAKDTPKTSRTSSSSSSSSSSNSLRENPPTPLSRKGGRARRREKTHGLAVDEDAPRYEQRVGAD